MTLHKIKVVLLVLVKHIEDICISIRMHVISFDLAVCNSSER